MLYLYLDESGDLGFDFSKPKTTGYFIITLLVIESGFVIRNIEKAVARTLKSKVNYVRKKNISLELKGSKTSIGTKRYFYRQIKNDPFSLYVVVFNKKKVPETLRKDKERLYNYLARLIIERCPLKKASSRIIITLDRCKTKEEQRTFDAYLLYQLEGSLSPKVKLNVFHLDSKTSKGLQAVDLFCWGIFRKYENKNLDWYEIFKEKICFEEENLSA
ncbi:MAG: DUF3800 domain-containing protein [bacterium]